ncbi:MAG: hypothetical protein L6Q99_15165 [Planctomycetes bacterium]|nr:hypothetical protein [Planctomycetota bacterium]
MDAATTLRADDVLVLDDPANGSDRLAVIPPGTLADRRPPRLGFRRENTLTLVSFLPGSSR